jgi:RNA polymerase sigma-70 factor (ECF subfamily)
VFVRSSTAVPIAKGASMELEQERELVSRIRSGDAAAFERLYAEYAAGLLAFAYTQLRSREVAEELVQELYLNLWKYREKWVLTRSLKAYLFGALRNRISSYRRTMAARHELQQGTTDGEAVLAALPSGARSDDLVHEAELREAIERAVSALPRRCRETFLLVRRQHLSYAEAAEVMGISVKAVEMNIVRAFSALRRELANTVL